ncbi:MAG TPA: UDP-N-acetylmuramate dehydrogenase [Burkholderiaceae bacterium]|nr:UDP-N-acetylmuramate dehydrogenase [Burkholderiaceae bacterium]
MHISEQDLSFYNTLGLKSQARAFLRLHSTKDLNDLSETAARYPGVVILGGGSNVVLAPRLEELVVHVSTRGIGLVDEDTDSFLVEVQAGEPWHSFVGLCTERGWHGLENLALVPGTCGAAPIQNIGAYGVEQSDFFHSLVAWDMQRRMRVEMGPGDCLFAYRDSFFKRAEPGRWLILAVRYRFPREWKPRLGYPDLARHPGLALAGAAVTPRQVFDAVCEIRRAKLPDPAELANAGSFFKNPVVDARTYRALRDLHPGLVAYPVDDGAHYKLAAGWLIERSGWKGRRLGPVGMHERQALVMVNHGGASARDIQVLADVIRAEVATRFGVHLEQEPLAMGSAGVSPG